MIADIDAILDEELAAIQSVPTACRTCRQIAEKPHVGEYISKGLERGMTMRQVIAVIGRRCGVDVSYDSLRNHIGSKHGG